jgi:hypothetical protein
MLTPTLPTYFQTRAQRFAGLALLVTASILVLSRPVAVRLDPSVLSVVLLSVAVVAAFAVSRVERGFSSLIGLFLVTTVVFNLGRPILWLILRDEQAYQLTFGFTVDTPQGIQSELLFFWCVGIAGFVGGYFAVYRVKLLRLAPLGKQSIGYCRRCFWITLLIVALIIPVALRSNLATFVADGYAGLYANQTGYTFSLSRALDFLLPTLFGLAVLLRESRYMRLVFLAVAANGVAGLIVGQRGGAGQWIVVGVWYLSNIRGKRIRRWLLVCGGVALVIFFQLVAGWREGYESSTALAEFMIEQGVTFLLPLSITQLPPPAAHTIIASVLPLGGMYSAFSVGSAADRSIGNYLSSGFNVLQFEQGRALGGTFYLELFYASGGVWIFYLVSCILGGILLRRWEQSSLQHNLSLLFFCMSVPWIVFLPRGTISAITSQIIYGAIYLLLMYLFDWVMVNSSPSVQSAVPLGRTADA